MDDTITNKKRIPLVAAIFSLIAPGLGHIYAGSLTKGLILISLPYVFIFIAGFYDLLSTFYGITSFIVILIGIYITALVSAIKLALKHNKYQLQRYNRWYWYVSILILIPLVISTFLLPRGEKLGYETYKIRSYSMNPTLQVGDFITVNTRNKKPKVGDVIVFKYPQNREISYVKRVAALSGDTISIVDGIVILNGQPEHNLTMPKDQSKKNYSTSMKQFQIPQDHIFLLGDARDNSNDSRFWGTVPSSDVIGKVTYIWFSTGFDRIGNAVE